MDVVSVRYEGFLLYYKVLRIVMDMFDEKAQFY